MGDVSDGSFDSHRVKRRRFETVLTGTRRGVAACLRYLGLAGLSMLDFLITDVCALCGGARPPQSGRAPAPPIAALRQTVHQRLPAGLGVIANQPVCGGCAADFDAAREPGRLGWAWGGSLVQTVGGEWFWPDGEVGRVADAGARTRAAAGGAAQRIDIIAPFMTNDNVLRIIHLLKYSGYRALAGPVAAAMVAALADLRPDGLGAVVVVPTPMERRDLRRRGFNQAGEIARRLAAAMGVRYTGDELIKTTRTARQSQSRHEDRADNVRGAFSCTGRGIARRHVLLVDDLVTTGATAASCSAAVLGAGARRVTVVCFGRAL